MIGEDGCQLALGVGQEGGNGTLGQSGEGGVGGGEDGVVAGVIEDAGQSSRVQRCQQGAEAAVGGGNLGDGHVGVAQLREVQGVDGWGEDGVDDVDNAVGGHDVRGHYGGPAVDDNVTAFHGEAQRLAKGRRQHAPADDVGGRVFAGRHVVEEDVGQSGFGIDAASGEGGESGVGGGEDGERPGAFQGARQSGGVHGGRQLLEVLVAAGDVVNGAAAGWGGGGRTAFGHGLRRSAGTFVQGGVGRSGEAQDYQGQNGQKRGSFHRVNLLIFFACLFLSGRRLKSAVRGRRAHACFCLADGGARRSFIKLPT